MVGAHDKVMLLVPELIITDPVVINPPVPDVIDDVVPEFDIFPAHPKLPLDEIVATEEPPEDTVNG